MLYLEKSVEEDESLISLILSLFLLLASNRYHSFFLSSLADLYKTLHRKSTKRRLTQWSTQFAHNTSITQSISSLLSQSLPHTLVATGHITILIEHLEISLCDVSIVRKESVDQILHSSLLGQVIWLLYHPASDIALASTTACLSVLIVRSKTWTHY